MPPIPDAVQAVVARYEELMDAALPGRLQSLYLVGSVALGDYVAGASDVDFVAVTAPALDTGELETLRHVHRRLATQFPRPQFSGIYVTCTDLQRNPGTIDRVPFHLDGRIEAAGGFDANPPIWLTLRNHPLAVRGPFPPVVWHDSEVLRRWTQENLDSYWRRYRQRHRALYGRGAYLLTDPAIVWCVSGVTRLHYTLTTGNITSKSGACRYGLEHFPARWHRVLHDALALRTGEGTTRRNRLTRRRDALDFMQFVIDDAL